MSDPNTDLLSAFDGHVVEDVRAALAAGADPSGPIRGKLATEWLLEEYTRSDRLPECLRLLVERGAEFAEPDIVSVLLDDADGIRVAAQSDARFVHRRVSMRSAFTSLEDVTLLHVAAEYGYLNATRALVELRADVNARAGVNEFGVNGHTPLFHTVNSNANRAAPVMRLLVEAGADVTFRVPALDWGKDYSWATTFFDVTPISYAQLGLLPQVHRREADTYENVRYLLAAAKRPVPPLENVPNRYLQKG